MQLDYQGKFWQIFAAVRLSIMQQQAAGAAAAAAAKLATSLK